MVGKDSSYPYAFYAFIIQTGSSTSYYSFIKNTYDGYESLIDWTPSTAINNDTAINRLNIIWQNDGNIQVYVNGTFLDSYQGETPFTDQREIGFYVRSYNEGNIEVRFDNFSMYQS